MISGRETLGSIEAELRSQRQAVAQLDERLAAGSARLLELGKAQAGDYRELARLRVSTLAAGRVSADLDAAEQRVDALLRSREASVQQVADDIADAEDARASLEADRATASAALEAAAAALDAAEARTQARLEGVASYRAQLERAREAERIAKHADDKATMSEAEQDEKGRAYREDPLFVYLWRRHYGTPQYRALPLFRWLDDKVARHAHFLDARPDYARLLEIPARLREHAGAKRRAADEAYEALHELDRQAREEDGIPRLEADEAEARAALQDVDQRLEALANESQALIERRQQLAAYEDEHSREAVEALASQLRSEELKGLQREARATPFPEDDVIVGRLADAQEEQQRIQTGAQELNRALRERRERLARLESLAVEFKRRQYDQPGQGFRDGPVVSSVVTNVLGGILNSDALWRVLEQQRRYQPPRTDTTFGSGGFGRGSPWGGGSHPRGRGPSSGRGGGGGATPGRSRGGFRTGGKF